MALGLEYQGGPIFGFISEYVLGVVERRARKPLSTDHISIVALEYIKVRIVGFDLKILPDTLPEVFGIGDRPRPQISIVTEKQAFFDKKPIHVFF
jgi:hypothetical protein